MTRRLRRLAPPGPLARSRELRVRATLAPPVARRTRWSIGTWARIPRRLVVKLAEKVGFEPTCRNYPTIRFRIGAVMTTSVPLRTICKRVFDVQRRKCREIRLGFKPARASTGILAEPRPAVRADARINPAHSSGAAAACCAPSSSGRVARRLDLDERRRWHCCGGARGRSTDITCQCRDTASAQARPPAQGVGA